MAEARRRPRLVGVIVLVLIALVGLVVIASLSLDKGETDPIEIEGARRGPAAAGRHPAGRRVLGDPDAPVTVEVFNDLQCTDCADYQLENDRAPDRGQVRAGEVKLVFHHYSRPERRRPRRLRGRRRRQAGPPVAVHRALLPKPGRGAGAGRHRGVPRPDRGRDPRVQRRAVAARHRRPEVRRTLDADDELAAELRLPAEPAVVVEGPGRARWSRRRRSPRSRRRSSRSSERE